MKKRVFGVFFSLVVVAMFIVPAIAKPTGTEITYTKQLEGPMVVDWRYAGESTVFHVSRSEQSGYVYEGDEAVGDPVFSYTAIGKMHTIPDPSTKQIWHFDYVWTCIGDEDSGFKGRLNGQAMENDMFVVSGVLQGFGTLKGQKLVVEGERQELYGITIFTGVLQTP